jgi:acyl carrier protein
MADSAVLTRVITVIAETFSTDPAGLGADSVAADVDGWDSVSHAMLIMNLEDAFNIELDIEKTMSAHDLGELAEQISAWLP